MTTTTTTTSTGAALPGARGPRHQLLLDEQSHCHRLRRHGLQQRRGPFVARVRGVLHLARHCERGQRERVCGAHESHCPHGHGPNGASFGSEVDVGVVAYLFTEVPFCPQELGSKERGRRKRQKEEHGAGKGGDGQSGSSLVTCGRIRRVKVSAF